MSAIFQLLALSESSVVFILGFTSCVLLLSIDACYIYLFLGASVRAAVLTENKEKGHGLLNNISYQVTHRDRWQHPFGSFCIDGYRTRRI